MMPKVACLCGEDTPERAEKQGAVCFHVAGKPFAKQRPRFSRRNGRAFTPKETVSFESTVGTIAARHFPEPITGPVRVEIYAHFEMPKSWAHKKREAHLDQPHTQRPDLDNVQKAICDGLNRIAYADDAQIAEVQCQKLWALEAGTTVWVVPL